jgi:hypothetical protein
VSLVAVIVPYVLKLLSKTIFSVYKYSVMYNSEKDGMKEILLNSQDLNAEVFGD